MKACSYSTRYKGKKAPRCGGTVLNPCDACLLKYFRKGRKVQLGGDWGAWGRFESKNYPVGKVGKVLGLSRTAGCIRLIFDGQKTPQTFHASFLVRVHGTKRKSKRPTAKA